MLVTRLNNQGNFLNRPARNKFNISYFHKLSNRGKV